MGRIWVDILTPKQVLFFAPIVHELERRSVEVLATTREYREVAPLAKRARLELKLVGERGEKGLEAQLVAATMRQAEMIPIVKDFRPSAAVSVASAVCARVAFGLGIKHISVNDSPHSLVAGKLSIPLSHGLACPWVIPYSAWRPYGLGKDRYWPYKALDPAAWLKRAPLGGPVPRLSRRKQTITVRVPETDAPYLAGADQSWGDAVLEAIADEFSDLNLVALCRYGHQVGEVKRKFGDRYIVPEEVVDGRGLLESTDVFVGMGGTMNAEAALIGTPTISSFQGDLYTDRYLKSRGILETARTPGRIVSLARRFLNPSYKAKFSKTAKTILDSMDDPVAEVASLAQRISKQG